MNEVRLLHTATLLPDGRVLVTGGYGVDGGYANTLLTCEVFDPATETWSITGSLASRRRHHTATLLPDGRVMVAGGYVENDPLSTAELYNPATQQWTAAAPLPTAPAVGTATLLPDGKVLVTKGYIPKIPGPGLQPIGEIYDSVTDSWTTTSSLSLGGTYQAAALLAGGTVFVCGGYGPGGVYYCSAEVYNPTNGLWTGVGPMTTPRKNHVATRLSNGNVLVTGGYRDNGIVLSSTELFRFGGVSGSPVVLTNFAKLKSGGLQFTFKSSPGTMWSVLATENPSSPLGQWQPLSFPIEMPPGRFQFTDLSASNIPVRFYRALRIP